MRQLTIEEFLQHLASHAGEQPVVSNIAPILDLEAAIDMVKVELGSYYRSDHSPTGPAAYDLAEALNSLIEELYNVAKSDLLPKRS